MWSEVPLIEVSCERGERHSAGLRFKQPIRKLQTVFNFFCVNCSKKSVSTHVRVSDLTLYSRFTSRLMEMHLKTELPLSPLCTADIQSVDRGIYIQFGTHGSDQQRITFKGVQAGRSPHKEHEL